MMRRFSAGDTAKARTRPIRATSDARSSERFRKRWTSIAAAIGGRFHEISFGADSLSVIDVGDTSAPTVLLSAGIHGDEPAAVTALASLVTSGRLDRRFAYRLLPCINPSGYRSQTRYNAGGADINRSFTGAGSTPEAQACIALTGWQRYALCIDLHEDSEASGFYAYDLHHRRTFAGERIVAALDARRLPVQELRRDFDLGYAQPVEGCARLERGRVLSSFDQQTRAFPGWPLATFLLAEHTDHALIFESPQRASFAARVRMHQVAVTAAIAQIER